MRVEDISQNEKNLMTSIKNHGLTINIPKLDSISQILIDLKNKDIVYFQKLGTRKIKVKLTRTGNMLAAYFEQNQ